MSLGISDNQMLALLAIGGIAGYLALRNDWKQQAMEDFPPRESAESGELASDHVRGLRDHPNPLLSAYGNLLPGHYQPRDVDMNTDPMDILTGGF